MNAHPLRASPADDDVLAGARRVALCGFVLVYGALSLLRWATYHSRSLDMAYYVRIVWGMAHGRPDVPVVGAPHWLGLHLEPILIPFAALARLGVPIAPMLLAAQAVVAGLALLPAHALARRRLAPVAGERAAFAAALTIYLLPTVSRCVDYDFHPNTMAIAPILCWIVAVDRAVDTGRWGRAWAWMAVALLFREDVGLQLGCAALALAVWPTGRGRDGRGVASAGFQPAGSAAAVRVEMVAQAAVGLAWFAVYAFAVQPRFLPPVAGGSFAAHFARFGGGAGGVGGVLAAALSDPAALARYLVSGDRLAYAPLLLSTVGFVALSAPRWLAGALPLFGINLLSDFAGVRHVQAHYATAMAPFLVAAGIEGAARLARVAGPGAPSGRLLPVATMVVAASAWWWTRGAAPGSPEFSLSNYRDDAFARRARARVAGLAGKDRVVADHRTLAHLAERPEPRLDPAEWPGRQASTLPR